MLFKGKWIGALPPGWTSEPRLRQGEAASTRSEGKVCSTWSQRFSSELLKGIFPCLTPRIMPSVLSGSEVTEQTGGRLKMLNIQHIRNWAIRKAQALMERHFTQVFNHPLYCSVILLTCSILPSSPAKEGLATQPDSVLIEGWNWESSPHAHHAS